MFHAWLATLDLPIDHLTAGLLGCNQMVLERGKLPPLALYPQLILHAKLWELRKGGGALIALEFLAALQVQNFGST